MHDDVTVTCGPVGEPSIHLRKSSTWEVLADLLGGALEASTPGVPEVRRRVAGHAGMVPKNLQVSEYNMWLA